MPKEERLCLECESPVKGRADKKFCDDQCRSLYNNRMNSDSSSVMRNVNNILRRNRRIMEDLSNEDGKTMLSRSKLNEAGFDFKYHTHTYTTQKGTTYRLCYDYGWLALDEDRVMVVKWDQ